MDPIALPAAPDFAAAHAEVCALCDHFDAGRADFTNDAYKEAEARGQFITPLFKALGWDVDNVAHRSVYEKDVVVEKRQNIAGHALSADYAFRRPGSHLTAFFVEAKKPAHDIRNHQDCYQAVQYGWNAKTPLVVLTNFAQLFVLDARSEPDKANSIRFILRQGGAYASRDYRDPEKFAELWGLLSRASVAGGSLDKTAAALPRLSGRLQRDDLFARGTGPVDETFLAEMEGWREHLAKQFKKDNHHLDGERLTGLTQRLLDRLVFLRFLEDRGIEREVTFAAIGRGGSAWSDFLKVSARLDARYNGIIYKNDPSGCEDRSLIVDDVVFAGVARRFAPENSKYLFNSISVTILGSIYERFLGNVIVSRNKTAIVEPKPEVRKAGGVYYTPDYIVRYIVEQTVGRAIDGRKPDEIAKLRFADIACGSGSFLVEVFACLIRYHLKWYLADGAAKWAKKGILRTRERDDEYVLTLAEKRRLLLNNVYGVDLDPQAVEVTQLSLYLRLMEDESFPSTQLLFDEERRALLPDLRENIICGNSLIETDIGELFGISNEEQEKVRPMDFRWAFSKVFRGKNSGFDALVGNPPYVFGRDWKALGIPEWHKQYYREHYHHIAYQLDLFSLFMERVYDLLRVDGHAGLIVPNIWLTNVKSDLTRKLVFGRSSDLAIAYAPSDVFEGIVVDTVVFTAKMRRPTERPVSGEDLLSVGEISKEGAVWKQKLAQKLFAAGDRLLSRSAGSDENTLLEKVAAASIQLGKIARIGRGVHPYRADGFGRSSFSEGFQTQRDVDERPYHFRAPGKNLRPFIYGKDIHRYATPVPNDWIAYGPWLAEPREKELFEGLRIYTRKILSTHLVLTLEDGNSIADQQVTVVHSASADYDVRHLAAVLGSTLMAFIIRTAFDETAQAFPQIKVSQLRELPIAQRVATDADQVRRLTKLVDKILTAKTAERSATDGTRREHWTRQSAAFDRQIDALVYELYGLTDEEIALVEGNT